MIMSDASGLMPCKIYMHAFAYASGCGLLHIDIYVYSRLTLELGYYTAHPSPNVFDTLAVSDTPSDFQIPAARLLTSARTVARH